MKRSLIAMACLYWGSMIASAGTIRVPQDYSTIQAAIDAALIGDEIVVSPGTYVQEQIIIRTRLTLRSTFDGSDWAIVNTTIIKDIGQGLAIDLGADGAVVRGFTITRDPIINPPPGTATGGIGGGGTTGNVEYCIIENHVHTPNAQGQGGSGAAILGVNGVIQNNIIRNNQGNGNAMQWCDGTIRNNLIYSNVGGSQINQCNGTIVNNTVYDTWGAATGAGVMINNIFWATGSSFVLGFANDRPPRNCIVNGYTGAGVNIITADPKFVDAGNGDFRLQADSPAIDAGLTTTSTQSVKADFNGVQRGLKGVVEVRGDGSGIDIGAFEFKPRPIAVWLPNGGPAMIRAGDPLTVAWEMEVPVAGQEIQLQLWEGQFSAADFGLFFSASGAGQDQVVLPSWLLTGGNYFVKGISTLDPDLTGQTPLMTILGVTGVEPRHWLRYR